jgi:phosphoribosylaminoimidazole carboxylase (NCAIR synthetase)
MNKSIAILGGGVYQVPLIKAAKSLGLVVHVVTPNGRFPGIHLGDSHIDLDTRDIASLISFFDAKIFLNIFLLSKNFFLPKVFADIAH